MFSTLANKKLVMTISLIGAVAFIGLIYFQWGRGGLSSSPNEIASINGQSIYLQDIKPLYESIKERYKDQINDKNSQMIEKQIMYDALRVLMQKHLILQQAEKAKVTVSDDQIMQAVISQKEFQTEDGKFNPGLYARIPSFYKTQKENQMREELVSQLFQIRLFDTVKTSDLDLRLYFQEKYTTCKIKAVIVTIKEEQPKQSLDNLLQMNTERTKYEKIIDQFINRVKQTGDFVGTANAMGLKVNTTDFFTFFGPIKKEGSPDRLNDIEFQEIYTKAFQLKPYQVSDKIALNHAFVAIQLIARTNPDWNKFYKELPTLRNEYEARLRQYALQDWYSTVVSRSKIVDNVEKLFGKAQ